MLTAIAGTVGFIFGIWVGVKVEPFVLRNLESELEKKIREKTQSPFQQQMGRIGGFLTCGAIFSYGAIMLASFLMPAESNTESQSSVVQVNEKQSQIHENDNQGSQAVASRPEEQKQIPQAVAVDQDSTQDPCTDPTAASSVRLSCAKDSYATFDKQLNDVWRQLKSKMDEASFDSLKKEQMEWIESKEKNCKEAMSGLGGDEGAILATECLAKETESRLVYLQGKI